MGRRGEPRIAVTFPVIVRGADSRGAPFVLTAETRDISCSGACLKGLSGIVVSGKKVEVEYGDQRAWFRVQWAGAAGSTKAGQAGLRCLEPGKYIWGIPPKEWEADSFDPLRPETAPPRPPPPATVLTSSGNEPWSGRERRQFVRHACRMAAQIVLQNGTLRMTATVTDISLGGCYMEMLSPLPVDTFVDISISPGDTTLQLSARVRSSQVNFGMGVSFTGMRPQDFEVLRKLAPPTVGALEPAIQAAPASPAASPAAPKEAHSYAATDFDAVDLPTNPEALAAAVRVLIRKGVLTRAEVMEELEKLLKVPR